MFAFIHRARIPILICEFFALIAALEEMWQVAFAWGVGAPVILWLMLVLEEKQQKDWIERQKYDMRIGDDGDHHN
jgi:hypothetical protein